MIVFFVFCQGYCRFNILFTLAYLLIFVSGRDCSLDLLFTR